MLTAAFIGALASACRGQQATAPIAFSLRPGITVEQRRLALAEFIPAAMRRAHVPGLAVALVDGGRVAWTQGFGLANSFTRRPVTPDTPFEAASLGKTITAYAALRLVEEGKLDLNRPLSFYLTKKFVADTQYRDRITAITVLTHTSGLSNNLVESEHHVAFEPGRRFSYSGVGFMYLQAVIEEVTHEGFNQFVADTIFTPLQMSSSSYLRSSCEQRMARGHLDMLGLAMPMPYFPIVQPNAANLLCSTASDLARFEAELMTPTLVNPQRVDEMMSPRVQVGGKVWWGLGIGLLRRTDGLCFWHWGDNLDFESYMLGCRDAKVGVAVMTNGSRGLGVAREIAARALGGGASP